MLTSERRIEVVVIDDHPFFRDGVSRGLTNSGLITVVAEAENGRDGLAAIAEHRPQVAVVDYQLPDLDGIAITQAVVRDQLPTKVLLRMDSVPASLKIAPPRPAPPPPKATPTPPPK